MFATELDLATKLHATSESIQKSCLDVWLTLSCTPESKRDFDKETEIARSMEASVLKCTEWTHKLMRNVLDVVKGLGEDAPAADDTERAADVTELGAALRAAVSTTWPVSHAMQVQALCTKALHNLSRAQGHLTSMMKDINNTKLKRAPAAATVAGVGSVASCEVASANAGAVPDATLPAAGGGVGEGRGGSLEEVD